MPFGVCSSIFKRIGENMHVKYYLILLDALGLTIFISGIVYGDLNSIFALVSVSLGWIIVGLAQYLMVRSKIFSWEGSLLKVPESGLAFMVASTTHYVDGNISVAYWLFFSGLFLLTIWFVLARYIKK